MFFFYLIPQILIWDNSVGKNIIPLVNSIEACQNINATIGYNIEVHW